MAQFFWRLVQIATFAAVIVSNIQYDWAHGTSPYAVGVVAVLAAWLVTAIPLAAVDLSRRLKSLLVGRHQQVDERRLPRV
jgi:hypothetical protein